MPSAQRNKINKTPSIVFDAIYFSFISLCGRRNSLFRLKQNALVVKRVSCFIPSDSPVTGCYWGVERLWSSLRPQPLLSWRQASEGMYSVRDVMVVFICLTWQK